MDNKHEFAIYYAQLAALTSRHAIGHSAEITDEQIVGRVRNILRLEPGESVILFDDTHHCTATIKSVKKSSISIQLGAAASTQAFTPHITMLLPLLKRDAMEQSLAAMCELGVNTIQPVISAKSQRIFDQKDIERAYKIMRASAEQSKQFAIPQLLPVKSLEAAIAETKAIERLFFDMHGEPLKNWLQSAAKSNATFVCLVGPEGDLTSDEKQAVIDVGFRSVTLTPTVLRSWQAAFLGIGIIRSYNYTK